MAAGPSLRQLVTPYADFACPQLNESKLAAFDTFRNTRSAQTYGTLQRDAYLLGSWTGLPKDPV